MADNRGVSLTQIHPSSPSAETDIDIIAIHGLDTKSPDTWISKSKYPDKGVNWLACPHMLPERTGPARIFMCDWPADLFEQPDLIQKTAEEFARLLLAGIKRRPLPKTSHKERKDRPIVFIASCLGGIILMRALLTADRPSNEYNAIRRSTRGIIFLATPFRGTSFQDVANWAEPGLRAWASVRGQNVSKLLDNVKGSTFHLEELVRKFTQLCQDKSYPCQVLTFYETGMTSLHRKFPLNWLIPSPLLNLFGQPKPLVDSSSANLDIVTDPLPLDRPHVMMNKFKGPEDADYQRVAGKIEEILRDIRKNSLLDDADAWIRNKTYTVDKLKIERLSGDLLPMDQCYINLAVVEQRGQEVVRPKRGNITPSPFSLFDRQKVETPDKTIQVELATIFNRREGRADETIKPRRILIRGRAGVGKTTLCKKIVHEFAQGTWSEWNNLFDRVLWVPLRNLKLEERRLQPRYDFTCLLTDEYFSLPNNKADLAKELAHALETDSSKTLFLLDGLDEVSQDLTGGNSISRFLNEVLLAQPNIIVTSRPSGKLPPNLDLKLETIGFYPDQVKDYIKKAFTSPTTAETDWETVDKVRSFLQDHWLIQSLVRIPVQLDALCYSWGGINSDIPETMTALYQAIELSLWKKDILRLKKTHCQDPVTLYHIQGASRRKIEGFVKDEVSFLECLAFAGLHNDVVEFELRHQNFISDCFPGFLPDKTVPCLSFLRSSNPSSDNRNRSYHFIHLTFQEYFAARYFVRRWVARKPLNFVEFSSGNILKVEPVKFFQKQKYTVRYDILWRFVAGLLDAWPEEISHFLQEIEEEPLDLLGPAHQRLVMHCLSEVSTNLPIRIDQEQRLSKWLQFECEFGQSGHSLLSSEAEFPAQALITTFCEGSDNIKLSILKSLINRATIPPSIIKHLASWLDDEDRDIREDVIEILGEQSALHNEILAVIAARFDDKDGDVRQAAISAVVNQSVLSDEILKVIAVLLDHKDMDVQVAAIKTLGYQSALPKEMLKAVAARLKHKDWEIRKAVVYTLARQSALSDEILKAVAARLDDKNWDVREAAVSALYRQSALPDEINKTIAAQLNDKDVDVRRAAVEILCQQSALPSEILKAVATRLDDEHAFIQMTAIRDLGQRPALPDEIVKAIAARLDDEEVDVRKSAIKALCHQSALPNEILEALVVRVDDEEVDVRKSAIKALSHQSALPNEILEALVVRVDDEEWEVRTAAISALHEQSALPDEILKTIAARLGHKDWVIRRAIVSALAGQSALPDEILKAVVARLDDDERFVREAAVDVLNLQLALPDEILKAVAARIDDKDSDIRQAAIGALDQRSVLPDKILKAVAARIGDKDRNVREAAIRALGNQSALSGEILEAVTMTMLLKHTFSALHQQSALPDEIAKAIAARLDNEDRAVRESTIEALCHQSALPNEILEALAGRLDDEDENVRETAIKALDHQSALSDGILKAVVARLDDDTEFVRRAAETILRRHREFYCTLLKGSYVAFLYKELFRRSFEEQLSWYIDDGNSCINMSEDIRSTYVDKPDDIRAMIQKVRPANFPVW